MVNINCLNIFIKIVKLAHDYKGNINDNKIELCNILHERLCPDIMVCHISNVAKKSYS